MQKIVTRMHKMLHVHCCRSHGIDQNMTQGCKYVLDWQEIANHRADSYVLDLAYDGMNTKSPNIQTNDEMMGYLDWVPRDALL
jgi:hypothetical protein